MDTLRKNFLYQHIDTPTRARGTSVPHLLDLVITDEQFIENIDFQAPLGKSDHSVLLISCNVNPSAYYLPYWHIGHQNRRSLSVTSERICHANILSRMHWKYRDTIR